MFWKYGALIQDKSSSLCLAEVTGKVLKLTVVGSKYPESLMRDVTRLVDLFLNNWYPGIIHVKRFVPCTSCTGTEPSSDKEPYLFTLEV